MNLTIAVIFLCLSISQQRRQRGATKGRRSFVANFNSTSYVMPELQTLILYMNQSIPVPLPTSLGAIFWLHIQKAGTSFGMTVFLFACPKVMDIIDMEEYRGKSIWEGKFTDYSAYQLMQRNECRIPLLMGMENNLGWHTPYNNPSQWNHTIVALFRHPISRIISAFMFNDGVMIPSGFARNRKRQNPPRFNRTIEIAKFKSYVRKQPVPIVAYANAQFIRSAMTKMVLGYSSAFNISLTEEELTEAKRRIIHDFAFVGLTEEYDASIELFHKQFGVSHPLARQYERLHLRKNKKNTENVQIKLEKQLREAKYRDRNDEEIYDLVSRIFYSRCTHYNITTRCNQYPRCNSLKLPFK